MIHGGGGLGIHPTGWWWDDGLIAIWVSRVGGWGVDVQWMIWLWWIGNNTTIVVGWVVPNEWVWLVMRGEGWWVWG